MIAVSTAGAVLAWIGLALGLVVAIVVVMLFNRVMRPALEIERYAGDVLDAGLGIARNVDGLDELERTRRLGGAVPDLAAEFLRRRGRA